MGRRFGLALRPVKDLTTGFRESHWSPQQDRRGPLMRRDQSHSRLSNALPPALLHRQGCSAGVRQAAANFQHGSGPRCLCNLGN